MLQAPKILKNIVERFRLVEYSGREGLTFKICLNVFDSQMAIGDK